MSKKTKVADVHSLADELRVGKGFRLADVDPGSTPGFDGGKKAGAALLWERLDELGDWQEKLHAESTAGSERRLLLVVQGMDTAGKGGIMRHVVGAMDPEGVRATAFKKPTDEERRHEFLWRIRNALPGPGRVGVFDRSHYEDVLAVRVHDLVEPAEWRGRYAIINAFERDLVRDGTTVVKVMLHLSRDEQKARLTKRLDRPDKYYKYNPGDVDERGYWDDYMEAYQVALTRCSTTAAPWYVVPADHKWYARLAVQTLLLDAFERLDPQWPPASYDVAAEQRRLAES
ncbi:polyphosphate kinase 2 family protein [Lapillicoccus jejuensis]|uniref:PPK2 family polyphosphate:nucleotide phosphotransferase n=1 Tax=Lapillicoccus jejuensis TaxID=402171 RepID=A0A542E5I0_9MICO|nr:polyphosphate kinase 2 family protein [Lapillicoccus jejuensis]TQJ10544.1 PPK2 family polyphosphate:nucleotide phosphotransferase [Lapillicoccus jejuensis]